MMYVLWKAILLLLGLLQLAHLSYGGEQNGMPRRNLPRTGRKSDEITLPGKVLIIPAKKEKLTEKVIKGITLTSEKALLAASALAKSATRINRDIKAYFSSDFEVLLLRMTSPSDEMTLHVDIERFIATTQSFIHNDDILSDSNTYRVTLRKIWAKVVEPDDRTALKALYMLHTLLKYSKLEDGILYRKLMVKMAKEYSAKSKTKYFNVQQLGIPEGKLAAVEHSRSRQQQSNKFLKSYAAFVTMRGNTFVHDFEDLNKVDYGTKAKEICSLLHKARDLIDGALACSVGLQEESEIVAYCLELTVRDIVDLWQKFGLKLQWLLREHEVGDIFEGWNDNVTASILGKLKDFYSNRYDVVQAMLVDVKELVELYKDCELPTHLGTAKNPLDNF